MAERRTFVHVLIQLASNKLSGGNYSNHLVLRDWDDNHDINLDFITKYEILSTGSFSIRFSTPEPTEPLEKPTGDILLR